ncbi:MAG: Rv0340 family IniB-related protein [Mycobacterium sp.]
MANSLLDFVMSLVRDPDAAAHYAADPAQAIADADLTDVTSVDVQNLIPVVTESLSMATPSYGLDAFGVDAASNVWTSGAATAAFDAFADHVPEATGVDVIDTPAVVTDITDDANSGLDALTGTDLVDTAVSLQLDEPMIEDTIVTDPALAEDWAQPVADAHPEDHTPGFDIFD